MVRLGEINPMAWDAAVDEILQKSSAIYESSSSGNDFKGLKENELQSLDEDDINFDWRVGAAAKRYDREMFEEYGYFKDFILHPSTQHYKELLSTHCNFNFQLGEPLLPIVATIVLVSMIGSKIGRNLTVLLVAVLYNVNPIYVVAFSIIFWKYTQVKAPKQFEFAKSAMRSRPILPKLPKAVELTSDDIIKKLAIKFVSDTEVQFDHVLIGGGLGPLVAAAILGSVGRRCCVLRDDPLRSPEFQPLGAPTSTPLVDYSLGRIHRYQQIMDWVQSWAPGERCYFAPIGSSKDGFAAAVVKYKHASGSGYKRNNNGNLNNSEIMILRAGEDALLNDISASVESKLSLGTMIAGVRQAFGGLTGFVFSRVQNGKAPSGEAAPAPAPVPNDFEVLCQATVRDCVNKALEAVPVKSIQTERKEIATWSSALFAALSWASNSSLFACHSAVCVGSLDASLSNGMFYPVGGPAAIERSLIAVIERYSGQVVTVPRSHSVTIAASKSDTEDDTTAAVEGINIVDEQQTTHLIPCKSVISGHSLLRTFAGGILPPECVSSELQSRLAKLTVMPSKALIVFWISGRKDELGLASADFVSVQVHPSSHHAVVASSDVERVVTHETICEEDNQVEVNPSTDRANELSSQSTRSLTSEYVKVWSPSAKDPSWPSESVSVVIVEIEHTSELDQNSDLTAAAMKILNEVYPLCAGRVLFTHVEANGFGGQEALPTCDKFKQDFKCPTEIQGLHLCCSDIFQAGAAGEIQGGWVAAHSILGYSEADLLAGRNAV